MNAPRAGPVRPLALALAAVVAVHSGARCQQGADPARPSIEAAPVELILRGQAAEGSVGFGRAFELDVVRRSAAGTSPEEWRDGLLAPLSVEEISVARVRDGDEVVETRRFRAWAFRRGAVTLQPASGSPPRTLLVDSCLPQGDDGALELLPAPPLGVLPVRRVLVRFLAIAAAAGAVAWLALAAVRALRRRAAMPPPWRARLSAQVEALAARAPASRQAQRADALAATAVLRDAARLLPEASAAGSVHRLLEAVKFEGRVLTPQEREALLDGLRRVVAALPDDGARNGGAPVPAPTRPGAA